MSTNWESWKLSSAMATASLAVPCVFSSTLQGFRTFYKTRGLPASWGERFLSHIRSYGCHLV